MRKRVLGYLQYAFFLGLGIFLVWWSLRKISSQDWEDVKKSFLSVRYLFILPVCIALLASHYSRAIRWRILIEPLGYKPRTTNTYIAVLVGYLANLAVPRLGEVLKCTFLSKYEKIPAEKLVGTIVAERAFDLICLFIVTGLALVTQIDTIGGYLTDVLKRWISHDPSGADTSRLIVLLVGVALFFLILTFLVKRYSSHSLLGKFKDILTGIWHGLTSVRLIKNKGWFFFHSVVIWALYLLSLQLGLLAFQETQGMGIKASLSLLTTGSIAMIITPSGIGAYPIFIQETLLLYGIKESTGIAFGWLLWTVQFFQILIAGFIGMALIPYINKSRAI
jgi:uncharacterized protein (TIRG00374 family)